MKRLRVGFSMSFAVLGLCTLAATFAYAETQEEYQRRVQKFQLQQQQQQQQYQLQQRQLNIEQQQRDRDFYLQQQRDNLERAKAQEELRRYEQERVDRLREQDRARKQERIDRINEEARQNNEKLQKTMKGWAKCPAGFKADGSPCSSDD